ncbi:MAG TPA: sodium:solute symporter family protein [Gammaproteobacteria bacterium]|nr:sodium:solute symporter family protein [Gammaproteobacteria bacterium]
MQLTGIDLGIIVLYFLSTAIIGLLLQRRAARDMDSYYLGGRILPWYMLGLSNASGMFDISGTMWMVTLLFVYGVKSIWIPWLWPVFNQIFLMVFLSVWLRRSGVLTGAEWIRTRFGDGSGGKLSHLVIVLFAIISALGFLAYGFIGVGKFVRIFVPWETVSPYLPFTIEPAHVPHFYGIVVTACATFYVMLGGMLSLVWADVLQYLIMTLSALIVGVIAMNSISHETLLAAVPAGWSSPFFGWNLDLAWDTRIPEVMAKIDSDGYSLFTIFVMLMLFKGVLVSAAGPAPNYDMQKILATRSPKEGALMSGFVSVVLLPVRYCLIAGFTVLAVVYFRELDLATGGTVDFENILPSAIGRFAPAGIRGLLLAGLLAAFIGTFAATVNAAQAYIANDIYKRYVNPQAGPRRLIHISYLVSAGMVIVSTVIGFHIDSINRILQWIVSGLYGGYAASNLLKWYWWRLNGTGYFWGMLTGILCALVFPLLFAGAFPRIAPDILPLYLFPLLLAVSGAVCIVASLVSRPEDENLLKSFYKTVRPWGFWGPIHDKVAAETPGFTRNPRFGRDMFNVLIGTVVQTCLMALPIFIVIQEISAAIATLLIIAAGGAVLKKTWYDQLDNWPMEEIQRENVTEKTRKKTSEKDRKG